MALLCVLYVNLVAALLGAVAHFGERLLPSDRARRWLWCIALVGSMIVPALYRATHVASVGGPHTHGSDGLASTLASFDPVFGTIWYAASALLLVWMLANAARVFWLTRTSSPYVRRTVDGVPVAITDDLGPATVGVIRSTVLLPAWVMALPASLREYVVRHEDEHRRSRDAALLFVATLPLILTPWNLALWWQTRRLRLAVEMDCDRRVVRQLGDTRRYASLLLDIARAGSRSPELQPAFLGAGMLERRLTALVAEGGIGRAARMAIVAVVLVLLGVVLAMPHPVLAAAVTP